MIKLLIDGSEVRLAADISLEFYDRNPFFTSEGQHTLDIDISLSDPQNARIYRAMHRIDVAARPENRKAILYCEKGVIIRGTEIILEIDERSAKIQIVSGNSEFNFLTGSEKYLHDLDLGEITGLTVGEARRSLYCHYPDCEYVCTPVVAKASIRNGIGNMLQSSSTIYNQVDEVAKAAVVNLKSDTTLCPQPYLATVVARVLKALGYTRSYDAIQCSPELSRLILVHGYKTTKYSEMLENWTVSDFISEVEHLCGVCFVVDNNAKSVEIQTLANYYSNAAVEEIAHGDIIGDINKQFDQDPPDNLVYHNVAYKFPSTSIYKFYALDSDFARRIDYVDCPDQLPQYRTDYAALYNIWYKISGDNTNFYKTDDDAPDTVVAAYHSMKAFYDRSFLWSADTPGRRIPLEFPFIVRSIFKKGSNSGVSKCTRLGMVNQFGPRVDETSDDKMELRIVPVENVFCRLHDYYSYPLPVVENGDGDVGNITDEDEGKGVAERLVQGEATERSANDNMYVGFYMGVSKFECCGEERGDNYPVVPVTINSRLQMRSMPSGTLGYKFWNMQEVKYMDVNGNYDLSINSEHGMYNTYWQLPQQLDLTTVYVIKFRSLQRRDARHIFCIAGRKFYCQQLKYQVVGGRLSDIIEGTFYPLKN